MNIGIDLDGVIFDSERLFFEYAIEFDKKIGGQGIKHLEEIRAGARYDWDRDVTEKFFNESCVLVESLADFSPGAIEAIKKLKAEGHKLFCISARGGIQAEIDITMQKFGDYKNCFEKLIFKQRRKLDACREYSIDVMIDDYYKIVEEISDEGIPCIYFKWRDTLKDCDKPNVYTVINWNEVVSVIDKLDDKENN